MINLKYVLLDEITLTLHIDKNADNLIPMIFSSRDRATKYAEENLQSWQVIEVPFDEED